MTGRWPRRPCTVAPCCYQKDTDADETAVSTTPAWHRACALTIGNFDGVHRGHQAMLALLNSEARHRGVPSCVMTFEPHPRDYFAAVHRKPELAPARIATLRDKLTELARCGVDQCVVLPFDQRWPARSPQAFIGMCWCAAWARATCWWATTSALAPSARATTPCWTPPARGRASTWPA
jgi:hypothetical protein